MLRWIYVLMHVALSVAISLPAVLIALLLFSAIGGVWIGVLVTLLLVLACVLTEIRFVALEGFGRDVLVWWPVRGEPPWPLGVRLAVLIGVYVVVGSATYLVIVSGETAGFEKLLRDMFG
jgi:hypothetical protein